MSPWPSVVKNTATTGLELCWSLQHLTGPLNAMANHKSSPAEGSYLTFWDLNPLPLRAKGQWQCIRLSAWRSSLLQPNTQPITKSQYLLVNGSGRAKLSWEALQGPGKPWSLPMASWWASRGGMWPQAPRERCPSANRDMWMSHGEKPTATMAPPVPTPLCSTDFAVTFPFPCHAYKCCHPGLQ